MRRIDLSTVGLGALGALLGALIMRLSMKPGSTKHEGISVRSMAAGLGVAAGATAVHLAEGSKRAKRR